MRWAIGTPFLDSQNWLFMVGAMRTTNSFTLHLVVFWIGVSWD